MRCALGDELTTAAVYEMSSVETSDLAGRLAESEVQCQQLEAQLDIQTEELSLLRARVARYEIALRGSQVTVYTQDRNLRFTSITNPVLGHSIEEILGRTDEEIFPLDGVAAIVALKRESLEFGQSLRKEIKYGPAPGGRWHDMHVEPLRNDAGEIVGLTCATIDVTERKEGEAHLRHLLRELTHRSKNLLAMIQGMARQTARHAGSIDSFLRQFGARLQALAAAHDLLVRESWHSASLGELIRSQLAGYIERGAGQVEIEGPLVALKPEAVQDCGLALHELAVNAAKFGALSVPDGRISISWEQRKVANGEEVIVLNWQEQFGPKVKARRKKGFGSLMIETNLVRALDTEVKLEFNPDGVRCRILIPLGHFIATR
jgi:PAS domain S-box-containing protein